MKREQTLLVLTMNDLNIKPIPFINISFRTKMNFLQSSHTLLDQSYELASMLNMVLVLIIFNTNDHLSRMLFI